MNPIGGCRVEQRPAGLGGLSGLGWLGEPVLRVGTVWLVLALLALPATVGCDDGSGPAGGGPSGTAASSASVPREASAGGVPGSPQAAAAVKAFYTRYAADPSRRTAEQYLTDAALVEVFATGGGSDRVFCAQVEPRSVSFDPPVMADDRATVIVTTHQDVSPDRRITVTVDLPEMLISKITCPE